MTVLTDGPDTRADRAASAVLYNAADARIVGFHLQPGQRVAEHRSTSTVTIHVTAGSGLFRGADSAFRLEAGQIAVFEPNETHAIDAGTEALRFVAIITPRPA